MTQFPKPPAHLLIGYFSTLWIAGLLCVALVAAGAATWFQWKRRGRTFAHSALLGGVVFFVLAVVVATLLRDGWPRTVRLDGWNDWSSRGWDRITYDPSAREILANGLLFLPLAFCATLLTRRPAAVAVCTAGSSVLIEVLQGVTYVGVPDVSDLIANTSGALVGVISALLLLLFTKARHQRAFRISAVLVGSFTVLLAAASLVIVPRAADARQSDLHAELQEALGDTTVEQYEEWEQRGQLTDQVFRVASVYIDGHAFPPAGYTGRWPATFLWESRCVFVDWTPQGGARVRDGSGEKCRRFMS